MTILNTLLMLSLWTSFKGLISAMLQPLYWAVSGIVVLFHKLWLPVVGNHEGWAWTLAIISLTIFIRTLLIPLFVKQINSARNMQLVQPKMKAIQDKYGHDREKAGQEMMKLYREEGVNPTASCLPLLLQMPIFLALFRVLQGASSGTPRGKFFKENPALVDSLQNAQIFGAKLAGRFIDFGNGFGATQVLAVILILAMTGLLFITQLQLMRKNMPPESLTGPMAQQQKMMLYLFPVMYLFSGVYIQIGVLIYWLTSNLWTFVQQYILIYSNPTPNTPAYVDWQERMRAKGKDPDQIEADRRDKRNGKRKVAAETTPATKVGEDGVEKAAVSRQKVTRQTTRPAAGSGSTTGRQQPVRQTRATRKK